MRIKATSALSAYSRNASRPVPQPEQGEARPAKAAPTPAVIVTLGSPGTQVLDEGDPKLLGTPGTQVLDEGGPKLLGTPGTQVLDEGGVKDGIVIEFGGG